MLLLLLVLLQLLTRPVSPPGISRDTADWPSGAVDAGACTHAMNADKLLGVGCSRSPTQSVEEQSAPKRRSRGSAMNRRGRYGYHQLSAAGTGNGLIDLQRTSATDLACRRRSIHAIYSPDSSPYRDGAPSGRVTRGRTGSVVSVTPATPSSVSVDFFSSPIETLTF